MKNKWHSSFNFLILGYAFLYLPLAVVVIYSFNSSRVFSVWQGFSTAWYASLLDNDALFSAVFSSLKLSGKPLKKKQIKRVKSVFQNLRVKLQSLKKRIKFLLMHGENEKIKR